MMVLQKKQIAAIEELIQSYSGILLERVTSRGISSKIIEHMQALGITRFEDYLMALDSGMGVKPALAELISELTISESYFFRNPDQFDFLLNHYLPENFKTRGSRHPFRIWSAGCAKGEEAYSLVLIAEIFRQLHPACNFHIYAGDINQKNVFRAKEGHYGPRALRKQTKAFAERLNIEIGIPDSEDGFYMPDNLKSMVRFRNLNLKQIHSLKCLAGSDIIFCRNVLIYFKEEFRKTLIEEFFRLLLPGGLLCLGESECLPNGINEFEILNHKNSYCYRKPAG
jgi:chemotaxis protein methyltransferase CheR